ncbi:hypothetical protein FACS1894205_5780 [Alphaproteobacteria bacterium]|nr:hypothetical protein FACS1894205_5780 [Alphaproteobacteria bacterium]
MRGAHRPVLAFARLLAFLLFTLFLLLPYAALLVVKRNGAERKVACFYWRTVCRIVGIKIVVCGEASKTRPCLFVSNHASYFDIIVLGALLPAVFVAKREVGQWPGFGVIARLGRTIFIERRSGKSREQRDEMVERLAKESLILFPEGTSNDGNRVLPFKSALFSVVESLSIPVQPVSIAYAKLDGFPIGRAFRSLFAWYGDMNLAPHLWEALGMGEVTVEVTYHRPVVLADFPSRKELSGYCHHVVESGVAKANIGRKEEAS